MPVKSLEQIPRIVIAAPHGASGKTTLSIGILAALARKGIAVQPLKKGPDFIDPSWMSAAAGRECRNLDLFMMGNAKVKESMVKHCRDVQLAYVEGNMGLFDGLDVEGSNSTAQLARVLGAPVVLVVDVTRMTRSIAALVAGFQSFEQGVRIAGVILNKVGSARQERLIRDAIARYCRIPVIGAVPKKEGLTIPCRHLGLIPEAEQGDALRLIEKLRVVTEEYVDLSLLLEVAGYRGESPVCSYQVQHRKTPGVRIGVIKDSVFTFYYPENLEALVEAGAELRFINSLADNRLGDIDGLYIGGGFPELFASELEANTSLREEIRAAGEESMPIYAECGGLMYLSRSITYEGITRSMVGLIPGEVFFDKKPRGHGYTVMEVSQPNPFFPQGSCVRGHEFHHSYLENLDASGVRLIYKVQRGVGLGRQQDGILYKNTLASYNHIHASGLSCWAKNFIRIAGAYRKQRVRESRLAQIV